MNRIIVGSTDSQLAIIQTELVINQLLIHQPDLVFERKTYKNMAGGMYMQSMGMATEQGLHIKELEEGLEEGEIDFAISSLKDLPLEEKTERKIASFIRREDARDVLLVRKQEREDLDIERMVIGTSSLRRKVQLECLYKGIRVKELTGTMLTRIHRLEKGEYDAIILAAAGVKRAGLSSYIAKYFTVEEIVPAAGQGILVVQSVKKELLPLLEKIGDETTKAEALAERAYVRELHGDCHMASGINACTKNNKLYLTGMYYAKNAKRCYKESVIGYPSEAEKLGVFFANYMRRRYGP